MAIRARRTAIRQRSVGVSDRPERRGAGEPGGRRRVTRHYLRQRRLADSHALRRQAEPSARTAISAAVVCQHRPVGLDDRMLPGLADDGLVVKEGRG
jgi:hypothetical protein